MSIFDIENISFDEPVTEEWLLSKKFTRFDLGGENIIYWWEDLIEVSCSKNTVTFAVDWGWSFSFDHYGAKTRVRRPRKFAEEKLLTRGQIINLINKYKNEFV